MAKELKVAIAGLGMGRSHLAAFEELKQTSVVAICDLREDLLGQFGERYGVKGRYRDYEQMLDFERPDIFVVALPNRLHCAATIAGLESGAHVLCEKPMAMNGAEAAKMCEVAERVRRRIMIGMSYRFGKVSGALKRMIEAGELGDVYFARTVWHRWRGIPGEWFASSRQSGGGALMDLGVHRIDLALWFMGEPEPVSVTASTYSIFGPKIMGAKFDVEDFAAGFVKLANGASLAVETSWACEQPRQELQRTELMGTRGGAVQSNIGDEYEYEMALYKEYDGAFMKTKPILYEDEEKTQTLHEHFADCIIKGKKPMASGRDGLRLMKILDAMYKSARTGRAVGIAPGS